MRSSRPTGVSEREAQVLAELGEHRSNAQIARELHLSIRTVESHVSSLLRKLGVADRRGLAELARDLPTRPGRFLGLPPNHTTFVGRQAELDTIIDALRRARLVSIVGPGGIGKTRLAASVTETLVARDASGGAFVDLVPAGPGRFIPAVADALRVTERPEQPLEQAVIERLERGPTLLVLDNCEHLLDEAGTFAGRALGRCPELTLLVTSRERLGVSGERVIHLGPLIDPSDARQLFLDRAEAADARFSHDRPAISTICARLDNIPLAIELAAARSASLGVDGLLAALDDRLRLLTGGRGADERHRSLRAVLQWSIDLLDDEQRELFGRLSVFVGGFDLGTAVAVSRDRPREAVADILGRLADKCLLEPRGNGWRMLATIRAFALDLLAARGDRELTYTRYLRWAAGTAADLEDRVEEAAEDWQTRFEDVADDLRAALAGTRPVPDDDAHRLARSLAHITFARRHFREAHQHYRSAAERAGDATRACAELRHAAETAVVIADHEAALGSFLDAARQALTAGDAHAQADALANAVVVAVRRNPGSGTTMAPELRSALLDEAAERADPGDMRARAWICTARAWHENSPVTGPDFELSRAAVAAADAAGDPFALMAALDALGLTLVLRGQMREAHRLGQERLRLLETLPRHEPRAVAEITDAYHVAVATALAAGDLPTAEAVAERAVTDDPINLHAYLAGPKFIRVYTMVGRFDEAIELANRMWDTWNRDGCPSQTWIASAAALAAFVHGIREDRQFELWRGRALRMAEATDADASPDLAASMAFVEARLAVHQSRLETAEQLVERTSTTSSTPWWRGYARAAGAELAVVADLPDAAERLALAGPAAEDNDWAAACLGRAHGRLTGDTDALADAVRQWERIGARFERACTLLLIPDRAEEGRAELTALRCPPVH